MTQVPEPMKESYKSSDNEYFVKYSHCLSRGNYSFEFNETNPSEIRVELSNMLGQRMYSITRITNNLTIKIDLSDYPKGIYKFNLITKSLIITNNIVI